MDAARSVDDPRRYSRAIAEFVIMAKAKLPYFFALGS